jgi:PmbA/TldA metallopeptidase C-terminal domain
MRIARLSLLLTAAACMAGLHAQDDVVMKAMRDEMARSMKQLTVENLEKPYFISYRVVEADTTSVMSAFGALNHSNYNHSRRLSVEVRVGDYKLDSSHLFSFDMDFGTQLRTFNGTAELPLADDYKEIRRQIWIATDNTYKKAVEDLSKKRGLLQTRSREDESDDFSKEDPQVSSDEIPAVKVNVAEWERETRALSALFRTMPGIYTSSVLFNCFNTYTRYLTSEGTSYTRRQPTIAFTISAATQATDGQPLEDLVWATGRSLAEMPPETELAGRLQTMAHHLTEVREAPTLDNYNGPILVEGDAALMLFRASFIPSLVAVKQTVSGLPGGMRANQNQTENPFLDKIGARVLPDFLSLTDNPGIHEYQNRHLAGFSKFDEDGMPSREVKIVENGVLKTLLASRDPVRGIDHTTGSRHAGQATPSNLIVTVSNGLSNEDLHARFIELVKQRNRPFGMVVRKLRNNAGPLNVLLAYKCFPDGHEELVRGMQLFGFSVQSFKDIVAASRDLNFATLRYQPPAGQFFMPNESEENFTPISLLVPSVLLEDATMRKIRAASPNPPVSSPPFFEK